MVFVLAHLEVDTASVVKKLVLDGGEAVVIC